MDFDKLCMVFSMQEPYYGILLSAMDKVPNGKITKTLGVGMAGNVFRLYYNPEFISQQTDDDILLLLKHEVLHVAFNHFTLFEDVDVDEVTHTIANLAGDMEINGYIDFPSSSNLHPLLPSKIGLATMLGAREYFKALMKLNDNNNQKCQARNPDKPCNGGLGGQSNDASQSSSNQNNQLNEQQGRTKRPSDQENNGNPQDSSARNKPGGNDTQNGGNPQQSQEGGLNQSQGLSDELSNMESFDDHSMWPNEDNINAEQLEQIIDDLVVFAAEEVEKSHGEIPSEMKVKVETIRARKPKPVADWKRYFRRYLGNEFSELIRKSKKRESRRFPDAAGNKHRRKSHIMVAIDTSGSVSMPEYNEFFGQIRTLTKDATFHVVECDACIQYEYDFNGRQNTTLHGGGGTLFEPVIDKFIAEKRKYDALVYFTDGGASIPRNTPKETLWVISSKGNQKRERYKVNGASVVFIPPKPQN